MGTYTRLEEVEAAPPEGRVVAVGVFDGVHTGHQSIIAGAVDSARRSGARPTVVTFYPHPESILRPGSDLRYLTLPERKVQLMVGLGIAEVVAVEFDQDFAQLLPESFCQAVLSVRLGAKVVLVGEDFRFGRDGAGTAVDLATFGAAHGFAVVPVPLLRQGGEPVSSTRIRTLLSAGEVGRAAELLGRPHRLEGKVVQGAGRGRGLRAPTANLEGLGELVLPLSGVYVTRTLVDGADMYASVTSVGTNPTFSADGEMRVETLLLDFEGDLYGSRVAVDLLERIRGQQVFADAEALAGQIGKDVLVAQEVHRRFAEK